MVGEDRNDGDILTLNCFHPKVAHVKLVCGSILTRRLGNTGEGVESLES